MTIIPWLVFGGTAIAMLLIGWLAGRSQTEEGYLLYDRKLSSLSYLVSYTATYIGAGFFIVGSAYAYLYGLGFAWFLLSLLIGTSIFGCFASWLRRQVKDQQFYTMAEYYRWRFGTVAARILAAMITVVIVVEIAVQLIAGAKLLEALNFAPYLTSIFVTVAVVAFYLISSGFRAVVWTDYVLLSAIFILVALIGGVFSQQIDYRQISFDITTMPTGILVGIMLIGLFLPFATPHYWQRIFAAHTGKIARRGTWLSGAALILPALAMLLIGEGARQILGQVDPDLVFIMAIKYMGPAVTLGGGILLWAALMSTADTHAFSGAQILMRDILGRKLTRGSVRWGVVALLIPALLLSILIPSVTSVAFLFLATVLIIAPSAILHWFWRISGAAVSSSLIAGAVVLVAWLFLGPLTPTTGVASLAVSLLALLLVQCSQLLFSRR